MTEHSIFVEISSDHENAVESFYHNAVKQANEGRRFGVEINIRRVDPSELQELEGFENE